MAEKSLIWLGTSRESVRQFPRDARAITGFQLWRLQQGLEPNDWKPMPSVGLGVREVRIHTGREHRVVYVARFAEGLYVLHGFEKRSRKTAERDIALARQRLRQMLTARPKQGK